MEEFILEETKILEHSEKGVIISFFFFKSSKVQRRDLQPQSEKSFYKTRKSRKV